MRRERETSSFPLKIPFAAHLVDGMALSPPRPLPFSTSPLLPVLCADECTCLHVYMCGGTHTRKRTREGDQNKQKKREWEGLVRRQKPLGAHAIEKPQHKEKERQHTCFTCTYWAQCRYLYITKFSRE
jgi:hypothetical protein